LLTFTRGLPFVPSILYNRCIHHKGDFMYSTKEFDKDVQGLLDLIKMCDDLEKEENEKQMP